MKIVTTGDHMRTMVITLILGWTMTAFGQLPSPPKGCKDDISLKGYCSRMEAGTFSGPIQIGFFLVVDKTGYARVEDALQKYLQFEEWPIYANQAIYSCPVLCRT